MPGKSFISSLRFSLINFNPDILKANKISVKKGNKKSRLVSQDLVDKLKN